MSALFHPPILQMTRHPPSLQLHATCLILSQQQHDLAGSPWGVPVLGPPCTDASPPSPSPSLSHSPLRQLSPSVHFPCCCCCWCCCAQPALPCHGLLTAPCTGGHPPQPCSFHLPFLVPIPLLHAPICFLPSHFNVSPFFPCPRVPLCQTECQAHFVHRSHQFSLLQLPPVPSLPHSLCERLIADASHQHHTPREKNGAV